MTRPDTKELLWELSRLAEGEPTTTPSDEVLEAYRSGALSQEQAAQVEVLLGRDAAARKRLAELAGLSPPPLPKSARRKFLQAVPVRDRERPSGARLRRVPRHPVVLPRHWLTAAAVVLVTLVGAFFLLQPEGPSKRSQLPAVEASIQGLAEVRQGPRVPAAGSDFTTAEPDTAVTVGVVVDPPRAGLEVGLYAHRPQRNVVERLPLEATWESRSTAVFRAPARVLVGERPGSYRLFVVVTGRGRLPAGRPLETGEAPDAAFAGRALRVEPLRLDIVHGAVPDLSTGSPEQEATPP